MQIQADYRSNLLPSRASGKAPGVDQDQANKNRAADTPEYRAILTKATRLLSNPRVSILERSQILSLLARGQIADANGATGELRNLSNELKRYDPELKVRDTAFEYETSQPQATPNQQGADRVAYKDQSGDAGVSLKYPVAMNQYQAPLAVMAHEREHVALAQAEALLNNEKVTAYVSIHTGYDRKGRLIITGGKTTTITHPKKDLESLQTGNKLAITV